MNPAERDGVDDEATATVDRSAVGRASVPVEAATKARNDKAGTAEKSATTAGPTTRKEPDAATDPEPVEVTTGRPASVVVGSSTKRAASTRAAATATVNGTPPSTGASRVAEAVRSARSTVTAAAGRGPRRARLFVKRIDPWSVMKFSFAVSVVIFFVMIVATSVLYLALDSMHVFSSVNKALATIISSINKNIKITAGIVIASAGAVGAVSVVLITALSTLGAFVYNVCADLVGGIEVTLSEKE